MMNKLIKVCLIVSLLVCMSQLTMAQPPPPPPSPAAVPIDGGLGLLLAAGAGLGLKKLRDARKADAAE
jgi:hypothetical protein